MARNAAIIKLNQPDLGNVEYPYNAIYTNEGVYVDGVLQNADIQNPRAYLDADVVMYDGVLQAETATVVGTVQTGVLQVETATAAGTVQTGVEQVETNTVIAAAGITGGGALNVRVTAANITGSPLDVNFSITAAENTATKVATYIAAKLALVSAITDFWTPTSAGEDVILTATTKRANDATLNIDIGGTGTTATGVTQSDTSTNTTAGVAAGAGNASVVVTAAGMTNSPKTIAVPVVDGDNASAIGTAIRAALTSDANVGHVTTGFFTVSGATDQIILTAKTKIANDATMNIAISTGTAIGVSSAPTSANTTAGVLAGAGNASVIVTAAGMTNSPKSVPTAVADGDNASTIANKIRTALGLQANITDFFTVSGATDQVILTAKTKAANDATMNIAIATGTAVGITAAPTSADTTEGVAIANTLTALDMSVDVEPATKYKVEFWAQVESVTKGALFDFGGGTATFTAFKGQWFWTQDDASTFAGAAVISSATDFGPAAGDAVNGEFFFKGSMEINAAGTFCPRASQNAAHVDDTTVLEGATLVLTKI